MAGAVEARKFVETVRMADEGIELMRQNLRRRHPDESEAEIDERLEAWLLERPMDAPGRVSPPT